MQDEFKIPMKNLPRFIGSGGKVFGLSEHSVKKKSESSLITYLVCQRRLFGLFYSGLLPDYFRKMRRGSGVLISSLVRTSDIVGSALFPGDIDILIIPYDGDHLIVSRTLVVEVKIVRASFIRQGKSPNDFGFSQASALLDLGFPYAAVAHLIVSESSPADAWRQVLSVEMLDGNTGRVSLPQRTTADLLPADLMERTYGRLCRNASRAELGLAAVYIDGWRLIEAGAVARDGAWFPECRRATVNAKADRLVMQSVYNYYEMHHLNFLQTPRYDPES